MQHGMALCATIKTAMAWHSSSSPPTATNTFVTDAAVIFLHAF